MKLSEAIRKGSELRPQNFGSFYEDGRTCVMGAAAEALTGKHPADIDRVMGFSEILHDHFSTLLAQTVLCPEGHEDGRPVFASVWRILYHLNDDHKLTRERIADWVEQFESEGAGALNLAPGPRS